MELVWTQKSKTVGYQKPFDLFINKPRSIFCAALKCVMASLADFFTKLPPKIAMVNRVI
jgi:hypothetical protein